MATLKQIEANRKALDEQQSNQEEVIEETEPALENQPLSLAIGFVPSDDFFRPAPPAAELLGRRPPMTESR